MKHKAPLALMEQLIMLLVFALAAALCLQIYALSGKISRRCEAQGHAVTNVQNVAEAMKAYRGDLSRYSAFSGNADKTEPMYLGYDENWEETTLEQAAYRIVVTPQATRIPGLGQAEISARTEKDDELFCVTVCWQEVAYE